MRKKKQKKQFKCLIDQKCYESGLQSLILVHTDGKQTCLYSETLKYSLKPARVWKTLVWRNLKQNFQNQLF